MKTSLKMGLILLSMVLFAGLTACEQAEKTMGEVTTSAEEAVTTAKEKATEMLTGSDEKSSDEESAENGEKEEKENEKD